MRKRYLLLLFIGIILTLAVPALLAGKDIFKELARLNWEIAAGLLLLVVVGWGFNTARVRMLLRDMGKPIPVIEGALITIATEFAGASTPASSGMPATYIFLLNRIGLNLGQAIGQVAIIILLDILYFCSTMILAALAMLFLHSPFGTSYLLGFVVAAMAAVFLLLWLVVRHFRPIYHSVSHFMGRFAWLARRRYRLARTTVEFLRALRMMGNLSWSKRLVLYLLTLGYWLPRYLVLIIAVGLVTRELPVAYLFLLQGLLNFGGQMFVIPSGGGGVDAAYMALMRPYLDSTDIAFTLVIWRAYTFYWYLLVGGPIFLVKTGKAARDLLGRKPG
jgi:uncharacterized protein (TIRG00374 family)